MTKFEPKTYRNYFPLLSKNSSNDGNNSDDIFDVVYFDNAATSQKPNSVIEAYQHFYQFTNANVHRSSHALSVKATVAFEQTREKLKGFINASSIKEIIWTKGTTESINLVAQSLARNILNKNDEIVISMAEHHANIVPWQLVAKQTGALIKVIPLTSEGIIDITQLENIITNKTKIVACTHISNVIGKINPIESVILRAKAVGAFTLIDGAQAVAHLPVDVQALDCDFYVFSAHKMYGPTGVGILYGKEKILENMPPYQAGGEMIKVVSFEQETTFNDLPFKFEAGTPNIAGIVAFAKAIDFVNQYSFKEIQTYEKQLHQYCLKQLLAFSEFSLIVTNPADIPVISFTISEYHNHDIASALDSVGIAIRSGHHCAMPLMKHLKLTGCLRVSLAPYNTKAEIDYFIRQLSIILDNSFDNKSTDPMLAIEKTADFTEQESERVIELFLTSKSWDTRHRQIMLLSKQLPRMPVNLRSQENLINGCESLAWLQLKQDQQGRYTFSADSDAKIIRGLLVIILAAFNNKTAKEITQFDLNKYFSTLGLMQHLSPSRGNGVRAIVDKIIKGVSSQTL